MAPFPGPVYIVRCARRSIGLFVTDDIAVLVRAPLRTTGKSIADVLKKNRSWLEAKLSEAVRIKEESAPSEFYDGALFLFLGKEYPLRVTRRAARFFSKERGFEISESYLGEARKMFESWYKHQADKLLCARVLELGAAFDRKDIAPRISSAGTRWGSCSVSGSLRINWRLIQAPPEIIDYVIVHELSHLVEMNHSGRFWEIVRKYIPDFMTRRKWLRENGHRFGRI
ncbi:MAG: hypothetical protein A2020_14475 [Lentisphaerae bacterium GWF2_45_14]|nr:MAG: hypothetical protein A2020_14475 [Lentisphaerae bacterium GWF2_45_14]